MPTVEQLLKLKNATPPPPPPDEEPKESRKVRLLSKIKILHDNVNTGTAVEGEPDKQYCWVNTREERQTFFQAMGWTLVKDPTGEKVKTRYRQPDGTHRRADLILYEMDKEMYEAHDAYKQLKRIEALEGVELSFQTSAARNGAPTFKPRV